MPVTCPLTSEVNLVPSSVEFGSPWSVVLGTVDADQIVHGVQETPWGVTGLEAVDSALVPIAFVADTVKVYVVPLVRPETVVVEAGGLPVILTVVCATAPMYGVTV